MIRTGNSRVECGTHNHSSECRTRACADFARLQTRVLCISTQARAEEDEGGEKTARLASHQIDFLLAYQWYSFVCYWWCWCCCCCYLSFYAFVTNKATGDMERSKRDYVTKIANRHCAQTRAPNSITQKKKRETNLPYERHVCVCVCAFHWN